jgi:competence ComEA-like helix-hairpin-helix protein
LFLILIITTLLFVNYSYDFSEDEVLDISSSEVVALQFEIDSLRAPTLESKDFKPRPFNPNFITDFKAYTLGMSPEEFDRLQDFRSRDEWINSAADFKKVTGVSDSLLSEISPLFKFPEWITNPKAKRSSRSNFSEPENFISKPTGIKTDLNTATLSQLQEVRGIGPALAKRILAYRNKIGSFSNDLQLYNVWGLEEAVVKRTLDRFTVKSPKVFEKMDLNSVSASDIATIPGISFDLAKQIWEFRTLRERINDFSELEKIESLSKLNLELIQLYLYIE